jgi:hypothetical protein
MGTRTLAFVVTGLALFALAAPVRAGEGEATRFTWHPSLGLASVYDDNPRYLPGSANPDAGYGTWVQPGVELTYSTPAVELGADLGADVRVDWSDSSLSDEFYRVRGFAELDLLPGLSMRLSEAWVPEARQLGRPPDDTMNLVQTQRADVGVRYWRELAGRSEIEVGARGSYFTSEGFLAVIPIGGGANVIDPDFEADFWQASGYLEWQNPLTSRESGFVLGQAGRRDYRDGRRPAHTNALVQLGVRSLRFHGARLELAGGYGLLAFDAGRNQHAFVGHAKLEKSWASGWSGFASVANEFAANLAGNEVIQAVGRVGLEKHFGERTGASLTGVAGRFEDEAYGRQPSVYAGGELEIWRDLTRWTRVEVAYRHWWNDADETTNAFHQNRLMLRFVVRR